MDKKISIIIPCYNIEKYINRCVESIEEALKAKQNEIEIILIDDGSKDSTGEICNALGKKYSNILVKYKENGGLSSARNAGLNFATGEYIVFIDGDDFVKNSLIKIFEQLDKGYDLIAISSYGIFDGNKIVKEVKTSNLTCYLNFNDENKSRFYQNKHFENAWSYIYNKKFLNKFELLFKEGVYYEDVEFLSRALHYAQSLGVINLNYYCYNDENYNSITRAMKLKNYQDFFTVLNLIVSFGESHIKNKKYYKSYRQCYSRIFYGLLLNHNKVKRMFKNEIKTLFVQNKHLRKYPKGFRNRCINFFINIFGVKFVFNCILSFSKMVGK